MRYFKDEVSNQVFGYGPEQDDLVLKAVAIGWEEVTGNWPPAPTQQEFLSHAEVLIQENLDKGAQTWGYDSLLSAASYVSSSSATFKAEANALIGWRDAVWLWANDVVSGVKSGQTQMPTSPQAVADAMPKIPTRPTPH